MKQRRSNKLKVAYSEKQEKLKIKKDEVIGELSDILKKIEISLKDENEKKIKPKQNNT